MIPQAGPAVPWQTHLLQRAAEQHSECSLWTFPRDIQVASAAELTNLYTDWRLENSKLFPWM